MMGGICGASRVCFMVGRPVGKARTPAIFNEWAARAGLDAVMVGLDLDAGGVGALFSAMRHWDNCLGAVVTYPHKQEACRHLDTADAAARFNQACNVVRRNPDGRLAGTMTDGIGCVSAMAANGAVLAGADMLLVGAGGAGAAIAQEAARRGVARMAVVDIDAARRERLVARLAAAFPRSAASGEIPDGFRFDIACNATPLGMNGEAVLPFPVGRLAASTLVVDVVPAPAMTPWLEAARARGLKIQTGPEMVAAQFGHVAGHLLGIAPERIDPAGAIRPPA